ncbi:CLUMA_CG012111, isoform B [Clunio marinus]|uniref:CLUMA_CG012111, isoform B n=1 Tax=Clunio marinus TaxID=568069 RepID=A0A1J1IFK0_9DIPT|nr:CLUMA_CG012111, isoform B [Clunio marinus]
MSMYLKTDQFPNVSAHTLKGIDFLDKYGNFVKDRCAIEIEYASKLRFTSHQAFKNVLKETSDLAGQREVVAENLQSQVISGINLLSKTLRDERKKSLQEGSDLQSNLTTQIASLDRAKKNYEKAYREAEKAVENYQRADADFNLSRAEVEKQRHNMTLKCAQSDDAKNEYANQLQKTNKLQLSHFESSLPAVFNKLQELDEKRTQGIKEFIRAAADVESQVAPIIARCLEGIVKASESIKEKEDSVKVIERYQSGFQPPGDIPFEDLSKVDSESTHNSQINHAMNHNATMKGTIGANKLKKRVGIFNIFSSNKNSISADGSKDDFSDLPPSQRKKKLTSKIQEIQQKIAQEQGARDGLIKMKGVYESNTFLGDPQTVQGELRECEHKLEKLKNELRKYQILLEEVKSQQSAQHSPQTNRLTHQNGGHGNHRTSRHSNGSNDDGDDQVDDNRSLSRSASENNVVHEQNGGAQNGGLLNINNNNNDNNNNGILHHNISSSSASPESGLGTSHSSLPGSGQGSTNDQHINDDMYYDTEPIQPLGTCKALYPFEATSEGSIPMAEGEELHVIELDQGDGWTRVRRMMTGNILEEGFVPTSYIESTLFAVDHIYVNNV